MRILLLNINSSKNLTISFSGLKLFLFTIFLNFSLFLSAQEGFGSSQEITLHGDVQIYSSDENFNKKVHSKYIYKEYSVNNKEFIVFNSGKNTLKEKYDLKKNVKAAKEKKDKLAFQEVKKKIDDFERRKRSFDFHNLKEYPSSQDYLSLSHLFKDSATTSYSYNLLKISCTAEFYVIKIALDFLHKTDFHYYNNKSLDCCFSEVFSVRPPPVLA
ncbi:hypothetical protein [Chryseobacterium binzhouense]|uniref:hypothetical protein n=1 Tax=Chryseobacterium binzhouense TaxID=2593646 RepID=UPI0028A2952F|nr:hypothetical protein [Chryseobacterium binzhouense]